MMHLRSTLKQATVAARKRRAQFVAAALLATPDVPATELVRGHPQGDTLIADAGRRASPASRALLALDSGL
jgi:hypothetical protein